MLKNTENQQENPDLGRVKEKLCLNVNWDYKIYNQSSISHSCTKQQNA